MKTEFKPSVNGVSWKTSVSCCVVPAITAVSKPKSSPPSAPTVVAFTKVSVHPMSPVDRVVLALFLHVEASINLPVPSTGWSRWANLYVFALTQRRCPHLQIGAAVCAS